MPLAGSWSGQVAGCRQCNMTFKRVSYHFGSAAVTFIASTDDRKVNAGSTPPNTTMVLHSAPQGQHHTQLTYRQRLTQLHALCVQAVPASLSSLIARASCMIVSVLALGLDIRCSTPSQPVCCLHSLSTLSAQPKFTASQHSTVVAAAVKLPKDLHAGVHECSWPHEW